MAVTYFTKECPGCGQPFTKPISKQWQRSCSYKCAQALKDRHKPPYERFFDKVQKTDGCWLWVGVINYYGYGQFLVAKKLVRAHRFSWEHHNGPISHGLFVLHRCDVRNCVNPDHLFLGTQAENMADMSAKGRGGAPSGEANGLAKLAEAQILSIREDSRPQTHIARDHGVAPSTIGRIQRLESWKHV